MNVRLKIQKGGLLNAKHLGKQKRMQIKNAFDINNWKQAGIYTYVQCISNAGYSKVHVQNMVRLGFVLFVIRK